MPRHRTEGYFLFEHIGFLAPGRKLSHPESPTVAQRWIRRGTVAKAQAEIAEKDRIAREESEKRVRQNLVRYSIKAFEQGKFDITIEALDALPQPSESQQMNAAELTNFFHQGERAKSRATLMAFATAEITTLSTEEGQEPIKQVTLRPVDQGDDKIVAKITMHEDDFYNAFEGYVAENPYYGSRHSPLAQLRHALTRQEGYLTDSTDKQFALSKITEMVNPGDFEQVQFYFDIADRMLLVRNKNSIYQLDPAQLVDHLGKLEITHENSVYGKPKLSVTLTENRDSILEIEGSEGNNGMQTREVRARKFFIAALAGKLTGQRDNQWVSVLYPHNFEGKGVTEFSLQLDTYKELMEDFLNRYGNRGKRLVNEFDAALSAPEFAVHTLVAKFDSAQVFERTRENA